MLNIQWRFPSVVCDPAFHDLWHLREEAVAAAATAVLDRVLREAAGKQGGTRAEGRGDARGLMEGLRRLWGE